MTSSRSRQLRHSSNEGQPGSVVWFISFGDLLTLLLCFFLVLTPWDRLQKVKDPQSLQHISSQTAGSDQNGIAFASDSHLKGSVVKLEVPIFARQWGEKDVLTPIDALEQELRSVASRNGRAEVLVCSSHEDRARVVLGVGGVLRRSLGSDVAIRFVVSSSCEDVHVTAPVTDEVVGRIRILGT